MTGKRPSFQWYPGDWLRDPGVRSLSFAAKGLWTDMLCLMFENDRKGYLSINGKPVTAEQLARMTGGSTDDVSRLLTELESSGVFSRTEHGMIYSRRMTRDERKRELCREAGKRGGNPALTLKGSSKGQSKGSAKGRSKGEITPSSSTSVEDSYESSAAFAAGCDSKDESPENAKGLHCDAREAEQKTTMDQTREAKAAERKEAKGPHHEAIRRFCRAWEDRYGARYPFNGGKDGDAVKWILTQIGNDLDRFAEILAGYFSTDDDFTAKDRHSLGLLRAQLRKYLVPVKKVGKPQGETAAQRDARLAADRAKVAQERANKAPGLKQFMKDFGKEGGDNP